MLGAACWALLAWPGLVVAGLCVAVAVMIAGYFYRKIGGCTGDTFGAVCELVELVPAVVLAVWPLDLARWLT